MPSRQKPKPFTAGQLQRVCQVLADTNKGLTGSEIGHILQQVRVPDVDPSNTKWKRLVNALVGSQNRTRSGDRVLAFISHALEPARFQGDSATLEEYRDQVNVTLLLYDGLEFGEDGKFHRTKRASSLPEAEQRAKPSSISAGAERSSSGRSPLLFRGVPGKTTPSMQSLRRPRASPRRSGRRQG